MRVQELAAVRLERAHGIHGGRSGRCFPAVRHHAPAFAVDGTYDAIHANGVGESLRIRGIRDATAEQRRSDDHLSGAHAAKLDRALWRTDASADLTGQARAYLADKMIVRARIHGRVQVDDVDAPKSGEAPNPVVQIGGFDGELLALNQLDDFAAFKIDRRNEHATTALGCRGRGAWPLNRGPHVRRNERSKRPAQHRHTLQRTLARNVRAILRRPTRSPESALPETHWP